MIRCFDGLQGNGWTERLVLGCLVAVLLEVPAHALAETRDLVRFAKTELHMAVEFEIVLYAANQADAERAFTVGFERVAELNGMLSDYDSNSELSRLSSTAGRGDAVRLGEDLFTVLSASQKLSRESGGAFDVTTGPLTKLWRRARRQKELPTLERIAEARAAVGYPNLELDAKGHTAKLAKAGMRLDLGGIAKGFAADEALKAIKNTGISSALVRASGDIVAGEPPPGERGWKVGLAPLDPDATPDVFITLSNAAVSTSGDSRQFLVIDGRRYSHLIDPRTGSPVEGRSSVSVIAPTGMLADSLASAVSVLGPKEGTELVERIEGVAARTIWQASESEPTTVVESKSFRAHLDGPAGK